MVIAVAEVESLPTTVIEVRDRQFLGRIDIEASGRDSRSEYLVIPSDQVVIFCQVLDICKQVPTQ